MVVIYLFEVACSKRILLDKEVVRHHTQLHLDALLLKSRNAEDINITLVVLLLELPLCIQHLDRLNAGGIEPKIRN